MKEVNFVSSFKLLRLFRVMCVRKTGQLVGIWGYHSIIKRRASFDHVAAAFF